MSDEEKVHKYLSSVYDSSSDEERPAGKKDNRSSSFIAHPISDSDSSDTDLSGKCTPLKRSSSGSPSPKKLKTSPLKGTASDRAAPFQSSKNNRESPVPRKHTKHRDSPHSTPSNQGRKDRESNSGSSSSKSKREDNYSKNSPSTSKVQSISDKREASRESGSSIEKNNPQISQGKNNELSSFATRLSRASPLCFFLTKVHVIPDSARTPLSLGILDLLDPSLGRIKEELQLNYMVDVEWLYEAHKRKGQSSHPITILHGEQDESSRKEISLQASMYDNVTVHRVVMPFPYGTHHTKMMMFEYEEGLRVVVHTSNMIQRDWMNKTQGTWVSHLCPPLPSSAPVHQGESRTGFKKNLLSYLSMYRMQALTPWISKVKRHDFSSIRVYFVSSTPGRHVGPAKELFGHMYLRKVLQNHCSSQAGADWPVVMQCSSIGSLGKSKDDWLESEFLTSLCANKANTLGRKPLLKLVFPNVNNVRESLDGYMSGSSIPYSRHTHLRQPWLQRYMHSWRSEHRGRSRAMPHIKTYTRLAPNGNRAAWFLLTSANLSKAAWGAVQKQDSQFFIRSYEAGVLFLPNQFDQGESLTLIEGNAPRGCSLSLPYDARLEPYSSGNGPWLVDNIYKKPDSLGNTWPPTQ